MAPLPITVDRARTLLALTTVAALAFMGIAAMIEVTFDGREENGGPTYVIQKGTDYFAYIEVFGFPGWRLTGTWATDHDTPPDAVRLVAGSDVARILAGQQPQHVYATLQPWNEGGAVGTFNMRIPEFTCSGPDGGCETGDLPAVVFTRGSSWQGSPLSSAKSSQYSRNVADLGMTINEGWVQPALITLTALATVAVVGSIAFGVAWRVLARRAPKGTATPLHGDAPLEMTLRIVDLSRLYLGAISRSLYIGGVIVLLGGLALELFALPALDELHNDFFPLGSEGTNAWFSLMHWWIIPYGLIVAAVFWVRQLRQLRAEQRRWSSVSDRLAGLEQKVLG